MFTKKMGQLHFHKPLLLSAIDTSPTCPRDG